VKLYFKEFGHINNLTVKTNSDGIAATALIEYRSTEDVQSALLRNDKYFNENQIKVIEGSGLTLYVTNFPPTTDDEFLHKLFKDCGEIFSTRWPSLKYNAHRRFCYVSFKSKTASEKAVSTLDGKLLEGKFKLEVKVSDPTSKKPREGAVAEGREVHVGNLDRAANEEELKVVFEKYGKVENVKILRNMAGKSKGGAFVTFITKESATAALDLDKTKFKSQILDVELVSATNYKPKATTVTTPTPNSEDQPMNRDAIERRTITIRNIPDTVNDARIKALAESHGGKVVKLVLKSDKSGASIEYEDEAMAGNAALALDGMAFEGNILGIGNGPKKTGGIPVNGGKAAPALMQQSAAPIQRPRLGGRKKRGGLGS
jgi:RNA recognition motif-containing protein